MTKAVGERELVLEILLEVLEKGAYAHIVLRNVLSKYQYLDKRERAENKMIPKFTKNMDDV